MQPLTVDIEATDGAARCGTVTTARGSYRTPCFMPVGTRGEIRTPAFMPVGTAGTVKAMLPESVRATGADILLGNTYHLMLRPGAETVAHFGGLGAYAGWDGLTLTDSGGFQVFSLDPKVDDDGVTFRSVYDGSTHRFTPESAIATQELLGADIQMVLDVCPPLPSPPATLRLAVDRTAAWAERARTVHRREGQSLFGIVQGGTDAALRAESAQRTVALDFDGYGIGGLSVGETRAEMIPALAAAIAELPAARPRYLMGVGDPASLLEAIAVGVDQFDCVMQTRLGRHGTAMTSQGKVQMKAARHRLDDDPIDASCPCAVCARHSRGYLRHLFTVGEPSAARLLSLHNVAWTLDLMERARAAIREGRLGALTAEVLSVWDSPSVGSPTGPTPAADTSATDISATE